LAALTKTKMYSTALYNEVNEVTTLQKTYKTYFIKHTYS